MAESFRSEIDVGPPPVALPKRRSFGIVGILALLLIVGAGGGLLWLNLDAVTDMIHGVGSPSAASNSDVLASAPDTGVSNADFTAFQQQTSTALQGATDLLGAQQAELKRLSDQVMGLAGQVASLTAKIDQMQNRVVAPSPAASAAATAPVGAIPRQAPAAPQKRPAAPRPAGAISVGGAPLQGAPAR